MSSTAQKLGSIIVYTAEQQALKFTTLWEDSALLLFFLRNPGCAICRENLFELKKHYAAFADEHVRVAAISMTKPLITASLEQQYQLPFPMYSDASGSAYKAFGFYETTMEKFDSDPEVARRTEQAIARGFELGDLMGVAPTQLGGLVLFAKGAQQPDFVHVADPIYYYPPWDAVLAQAVASVRASS